MLLAEHPRSRPWAGLVTLTPPAGAPLELWWAPTDLPAHVLATLRADVDDATAARAATFVRREDAARTFAAHALLRRVLAPRLGTTPAAVPLGRSCGRCGATDHGAPVVLAGPDAPEVSLAHAGTLAVVAVAPAGRRVGVDVERVLPNRGWSGAFRGLLTESERLAARASGDPDAAWLRAWTGKEALTKATRRGLEDDTCRIEVLSARTVADGWWQVRRPDGAGRALLAFPRLGGPAPDRPDHPVHPEHQAAVAVLDPVLDRPTDLPRSTQ